MTVIASDTETMTPELLLGQRAELTAGKAWQRAPRRVEKPRVSFAVDRYGTTTRAAAK
jgi:hypothetical protein